jgi:hypothetical protein
LPTYERFDFIYHSSGELFDRDCGNIIVHHHRRNLVDRCRGDFYYTSRELIGDGVVFDAGRNLIIDYPG